MTPQEINNGNELIAKFMGAKWDDQEQVYKFDIDNTPTEFSSTKWDVIAMEYHSDWNWLMKVVEKIEKIYDEHDGFYGVHLRSNACDIQGTKLHLSLRDSKYGYVYMSDPNAIFPTKIESTWYAVVQFVKWYNQQNKNSEK